jgi:hypothetical protein
MICSAIDLVIPIKDRRRAQNCVVPDFWWRLREDGPRDPREMLYSSGIVDFPWGVVREKEKTNIESQIQFWI